MAVRLSALCIGRPLSPGRFVILISVRAWVDPRAIVRLEGLGQLKNPRTSSEIEPAAFRLVAGKLITLYWEQHVRVGILIITNIWLAYCARSSGGKTSPPHGHITSLFRLRCDIREPHTWVPVFLSNKLLPSSGLKWLLHQCVTLHCLTIQKTI
jgi:hypothetical protein